MRTVTNLGVLGAVGGVLRPIDLTLQRETGLTWDLTGYTLPELRVSRLRTGVAVAPNGTVTIQAPATGGIVRYAPAAGDPLFAAAGTYEARVWVQPAAGAPKEPSGKFRFTIEAL